MGMMTVKDYWLLLLDYLPTGSLWRLWRRISGAYSDGVPKPIHWPSKMLMGLAEELVRADDQVYALGTDANPSTTAGLLSEWEQAVFGQDQSWTLKSPSQRRQELAAHLRDRGGLSLRHWEDVCAGYGYTATCSNGPWTLWWTVDCPEGITRFRAGTGRAGDKLVSFASGFKRCTYTLWYYRPAGTAIWWTD